MNALRLIKTRACSNISLGSYLFLKWRSGSNFQHFKISFVLSLILLFAMLSATPLAFAASLEFAAGDGNPTGNGPTQSTTVRLRHNTDDPSGNTFATYNPSLTATFTISNQQYTNHPQNSNGDVLNPNNPASAIGWFFVTSSQTPIFPLMNLVGSPQNNWFTSKESNTAGTGISIAHNRAVNFNNGVTVLNGKTFAARHHMHDVQITFNRPVDNPIIHIVGMGADFMEGGSQRGLSAELELLTSGVTLSKLSGTNALNVTSNQILNSAATPRASTTDYSGSGSILVTGSNISSLRFRVYVRGQAGITDTEWGDSTSSDTWLMGLSVLDSIDHSDAPTSYGDASHNIIDNIRLGATNTADASPYHSANADGDVGDDGITLPTLTRGQSAIITAAVNGAGGYLNAWIDWDGNGSFDSNEQIAVDIQDNGTGDLNTSSGLIDIPISVPPDATLTQTFARFRWSTQSNLSSGGPATDGEVEDYALTINPIPPLQTSTCPIPVVGGSSGSSFAWPQTPSTVTVTTNASWVNTAHTIDIYDINGETRTLTGTQRWERSSGSRNVTLTLNFSNPVPANEIVLFLLDVGTGAAGVYDPTYTFKVNGQVGTNDFVMKSHGATYPTTLVYTPSNGSVRKWIPELNNRESGALVGQSNTLVSSLSLTSVGVVSADLIAYLLGTVVDCQAISGTIFEDINYGGGAGRDFATAGTGVNGVTVELYDSTGALVETTTTANDGTNDGAYSFTAPDGDYYVRVVNDTVSSTRAGSDGSELGVQTFRTDDTTPVTNEVGGRNPAVADTAANAGGNLDTTTFELDGGQAQSVTPVTVTGTDVTGVDFGFNFSTIVNTNDAGQGSLRQFTLNANLLDNSSLAIVGQPTARDISIFMIPNGTAVAGLQADKASQLTSGVASIILSSQLEITRDNVSLDGTTQATNVGDTNSGSAGYSGAVGTGTGAGTINQVDRPEVEINFAGTSTLLDLNNALVRVTGSNSLFRGLALRKTDGATNNTPIGLLLMSSASNALIEQNYIGTSAIGFADAGVDNRLSSGVYLLSGKSTMRNNLIGYVNDFGVAIAGADVLIEENSFAAAGMNSPNSNPQEQVRPTGTGPVRIRHNYLGETTWGNMDLATASNVTVLGNTIENGMQQAIGNIVPAQNAAIGAMSTEDAIISHNIIRNTQNGGHGILVNSRSYSTQNINSVGVRITENSIYDNAGLGINVNISDVATDSTDNNVTPNDGLKDTNTANHGMDYPIITEAFVVGTELTLRGYIGTNPAGDPLFGNSEIEFFIANDDGNNNGEVILGDGLSEAHGEGKTYLLTTTSDANGLFDITVPAGSMAVNSAITATATDTSNNTSEFSANFIVRQAGYISGRVYQDSNANAADDAEAGIPNVTVVLHDPSTGTCQSVATAADGSYRFNVMPGDYTLYEAANEVIQTPDSCPPATNDPNGFLSTTPNDQTVTVSNASVTGLDFGDVREPSLALDHTTTTQPNTLVPYPHTFKAHTDGSVSFSFSETADPNTLNWGTGLMQDVNCDAQLDEGDVNVPLNTPRALNAGDTLCLIVKVIAPANASSGATHTLNLQSDFTYGNGSTGLANSVLTRTDITRVLADTPRPTEPVGGEGKLSLQKSVWNVTRGISGEVALPGETLRYTVQYENVGNGPLNDLVINDSVPEFTTLQGTPQCGTTPTDLGTCTPSALGASLDWSFSGTLPAGDRGNVLFEVIVD